MSQRLVSGHEVGVMDEEYLKRIGKRMNLCYKSGVIRIKPEGWLYPGKAQLSLDKLHTFEV